VRSTSRVSKAFEQQCSEPRTGHEQGVECIVDDGFAARVEVFKLGGKDRKTGWCCVHG
jgi:hypothetical protein